MGQELEARLVDLVLSEPGTDNFKNVTKKLEAALDKAHEQSALSPTVVDSADAAFCHAIGKPRPKPEQDLEEDHADGGALDDADDGALDGALDGADDGARDGADDGASDGALDGADDGE